MTMTRMLDGGWGKGAFPCADVYITPVSPPVLAVQTMGMCTCVLYGSYDCVSNGMHTIYTCLLY